MDAKHTPGPWHTDLGYVSREHYKGRIQEAVWDEDGACIAACMDNAANALLIAAAPDLLEACRRLLGWDVFDQPTGRAHEDAAFARAAIAKATGAQP